MVACINGRNLNHCFQDHDTHNWQLLHIKVKGNGNCMFTTIKKSLQVRHSGPAGAKDKDRELPYYPNRYFRRQVVHWMAVNRQKVMHYMGQAIRATYGVVDPTASHGGPFGYATYLMKLLLGR